MVYLRGIIVAVNWDENGNAAGFGIETFDEDFYLIDGPYEVGRLNRICKGLLDVLNRQRSLQPNHEKCALRAEDATTVGTGGATHLRSSARNSTGASIVEADRVP